MKVAVIIAKILLGLVFVIFGLNGFLNFIPVKTVPTGMAGQFFAVFVGSHWALAVSAVQIVGGALLLVNRFVPLALTLLGPVIVNILLYHILIDHSGIGVAIVVAILWFILFFRYKKNFEGIFEMTA